ncbi:hypothetical protein [Desulfallas thermosapovorans]|uniref:Uncharacterized protein n=1 Tax=Desulfallas thermosapovorans DSM 6562 TaxID=1121431 RepID=A0A5S4ZZ29_9FIRM|nr:hypothetical protein [Desulfallas thermosapovorans]TYO97989.1 hypothetical protein LX24_00273 [Desulfallas thermosapovorans DSM 6562]
MLQWYIEDAGGGCRAFSEVLVLVCEQPRRIYKRYLPLTWDNKLSMEEVARRKVLEMMREAGVSRNDRLYVCSGNIFFGLHKWLTENGYQWETAKMEGLAHEVAESIFQQQIIAAGFPADIKLEERNYRDYYRQVDAWIKEDPARAKYIKDMKVRCKPDHTRYLLKGNAGSARTCSRCRKKIMPYSPIVHYRFREQGKKKSRFFHPGCSPVKPHKNKLHQVHIHWRGQELQGVVLPAREPLPCMVCGREVPAGTRAVYACRDKEIVFGHPACFEHTGKNNGNA